MTLAEPDSAPASGPRPRVAIKRIYDQAFDNDKKRSILKEARALSHARHHHVIEFITAYFYESQDISKSYLGIVMDPADSDIGVFLKLYKGRKDTKEICSRFQCLANALAHVHGLGITHRDIKPPNILVVGNKVLLADFGISKVALIQTFPTTYPNQPRARSPYYAPPEVEDGSTRSRSADIFSLGVVFLEMLVAHSFPRKRQDLESVAFTNNSSLATGLDKVHEWMNKHSQTERWKITVLGICQDMLKHDRDARPSIAEVHERIKSTPIPGQSVSGCCQDMLEHENMTEDKRLLDACKNGDINEVKGLVEEQSASPETVGALHQASAHGFNAIVRYLLSQRINVNLRDYGNYTALHCATGNDRRDIVELLLREHADVNLQNDEGQTPLHYAS
ncbi:hypothetical protein M434DRAFT_68480, partial [Hypoxylon sp. CO27-5]